MMVDATVITPSIPGREHLLADAARSVSAQTRTPVAHLIRVQAPMAGRLSPNHIAAQRNALLRGVRTKWTCTLDDDDVYLPNHFEAIADALRTDVDVVYTFAREGCVAREDVTGWTPGQLVARLTPGNAIPSNAAVRTDLLRQVDGWDDVNLNPATGRYPTGATFEDWDIWIRLAQRGARFRCVPVETYDYRGGDWQRASR